MNGQRPCAVPLGTLGGTACGCTIQLFTFGPVVSDGYGVGYMIKPDSMCINVTAWNDGTKTRASDFTEAVERALHKMLAL
jgi:hypothetical protein